MRIAQKFTPEVMLAAPRRSPAVPNHNGTLALYTVSTYDFVEGKQTKELKVMNIETSASDVLSNDENVSEALWLPAGNGVLCLVKGGQGTTRLVVYNADQPDGEGYVIAEFAGPLTGMKLKRLDGGSVAFAAVGLLGDDGKLFNDVVEKKRSTARVFDTSRVGVWDTMIKEKRYVIWYSRLTRSTGSWTLESELHNLFRGADLDVCGIYDMDDPLQNYDVGPTGILFNATSLKPVDDISRWSSSDVYYSHVPSFAEEPPHEPKMVTMGNKRLVGRFLDLHISPDGEAMTFLLYPYENDTNVRVYLGHLPSLDALDVFKELIGREPQLPPSGVAFAGSSDSLILTTDNCGRTTLEFLKLQSSESPDMVFNTSGVPSHYPLFLQLQSFQDPVTIFKNGSATGFYPLVEGNWDRLLVSSTSFVDSSLWQIIDARGTAEPRVVSSSTRHGAQFGLTHSMVSEIWYEGADEVCVHSFIVKPSDFDPAKKYPWVLMPHGGPVSSWQEAWSTRWNAALWAEQGYVVVLPNIAGSVGYGLDFTSRVHESWGGAPYEDLVNLMVYLEELPYLDMDRAAIAGASYGGYLISWIFGQDLATKFRCAIWHDGITCLPNMMLTSDSCGSPIDFAGTPLPGFTPGSALLSKWDPSRPDLMANWHRAPPTLVVHSQRDFRCPFTEGLAAYRALKARGVEARFLTFEDEGHWVLSHENARVWSREVFSWLEKHIGSGGV
ncbi:related to secreted dipeptidyl-peptidase V precursor [Cephalotrichum gorgonifer]|uniref:Dipeptidyl-peptidase V n=1 Tax=Cephalotrichum gorgonifer TaxID=2041049 RepID=A0AAE8MV82_9PEZI|nr:related to secreted dipeptidyl-peptidase V precursor [Cephalotrichum gorgonifer]